MQLPSGMQTELPMFSALARAKRVPRKFIEYGSQKKL